MAPSQQQNPIRIRIVMMLFCFICLIEPIEMVEVQQSSRLLPFLNYLPTLIVPETSLLSYQSLSPFNLLLNRVNQLLKNNRSSMDELENLKTLSESENSHSDSIGNSLGLLKQLRLAIDNQLHSNDIGSQKGTHPGSQLKLINDRIILLLVFNNLLLDLIGNLDSSTSLMSSGPEETQTPVQYKSANQSSESKSEMISKSSNNNLEYSEQMARLRQNPHINQHLVNFDHDLELAKSSETKTTDPNQIQTGSTTFGHFRRVKPETEFRNFQKSRTRKYSRPIIKPFIAENESRHSMKTFGKYFNHHNKNILVPESKQLDQSAKTLSKSRLLSNSNRSNLHNRNKNWRYSSIRSPTIINDYHRESSKYLSDEDNDNSESYQNRNQNRYRNYATKSPDENLFMDLYSNKEDSLENGNFNHQNDLESEKLPTKENLDKNNLYDEEDDQDWRPVFPYIMDSDPIIQKPPLSEQLRNAAALSD